MSKKTHLEKPFSEIADLVLDMLADLPPEKAEAAKEEMIKLSSK